MTFCMGEFNRLVLLHKFNKEDIELCKMILLEIVYSWTQEEEVKPVLDSHYIHRWSPQRRHE